jgi:antitoxin HicB
MVYHILNQNPQTQNNMLLRFSNSVGCIELHRELWIETAYEMGDPIPLPNNTIEYSGKLLLRMPKSLHRDFAQQAEVEAVSLNQYISSVLSRSVS